MSLNFRAMQTESADFGFVIYNHCAVYCEALDLMLVSGGFTNDGKSETSSNDLRTYNFKTAQWSFLQSARNTNQGPARDNTAPTPRGHEECGLELVASSTVTNSCSVVLFGSSRLSFGIDVWLGTIVRSDGDFMVWEELSPDVGNYMSATGAQGPTERLGFRTTKLGNDFFLLGGVVPEMWQLTLEPFDQNNLTSITPPVRGGQWDEIDMRSVPAGWKPNVSMVGLVSTGELVVFGGDLSTNREFMWRYNVDTRAFKGVETEKDRTGKAPKIIFSNTDNHVMMAYEDDVWMWNIQYNLGRKQDLFVTSLGNANPMNKCGNDLGILWCASDISTAELSGKDTPPTYRKSPPACVMRQSRMVCYGGYNLNGQIDVVRPANYFWSVNLEAIDDFSPIQIPLTEHEEWTPLATSLLTLFIFFSLLNMYLTVARFRRRKRERLELGELRGRPLPDVPSHGTRDSMVNKMPLINYVRQGPIKSVSADDEDFDYEDCCPICLMDYEEAESVRQLPCAHVFHPHCVDVWLLTNKSCPSCKQQVDEKPAESGYLAAAANRVRRALSGRLSMHGSTRSISSVNSTQGGEESDASVGGSRGGWRRPSGRSARSRRLLMGRNSGHMASNSVPDSPHVVSAGELVVVEPLSPGMSESEI